MKNSPLFLLSTALLAALYFAFYKIPILFSLFFLFWLVFYLRAKELFFWCILFISFYLWASFSPFEKEFILPEEENVRVYARILRVEPYYDKTKVYAQSKEIGNLEFITERDKVFQPGFFCEISLRAKKNIRNLNPYALSLRERLLLKEIEGEWLLIESERIYCVSEGRREWESLRFRLINFSESLSPLARGLFLALVLGIENQLPPEYLEKLKSQGLYHQLAISGFNLAVLYGLLFKFWRGFLSYTPLLKLGIPIQIWAYLLSLPGAGIILILSGFQPPTLRAFFFLLCFILNKIFLRNTPSLSLLLLGASILVLFKPNLIGSVSFQLSFLATLALIIGDSLFKGLAEKIKLSKESFYQKILYHILYAFFLSLMVSLFTFPLLLYLTGTFPLATPINNLLATPFWSFIFIPLSIVSGLLAFVCPRVSEFLMEGIAKIFEYYSNIPLFEWIYQVNLPINLFLLWFLSSVIFSMVIIKVFPSLGRKLFIISLFCFFSYFLLQKIYNKITFILIPKLIKAEAIILKDKEDYYLYFKENLNNQRFTQIQLVPLLKKLGIKEIRGILYHSHTEDSLNIIRKNFEVRKVYTNMDFELFEDLRIFKFGLEFIPLKDENLWLEFRGISLILFNKWNREVLNFSPEILIFSKVKKIKNDNLEIPLVVFEKSRMEALYFFPKKNYFIFLKEEERIRKFLSRLFFPIIPYIFEEGEINKMVYK